MKSYTLAAISAAVLFGFCLFASGCGESSAVNKPRAEMSTGKMSDAKMSGGMMSDSKMAGEKMSSMSEPKMNGMAEGKQGKMDVGDK